MSEDFETAGDFQTVRSTIEELWELDFEATANIALRALDRIEARLQAVTEERDETRRLLTARLNDLAHTEAELSSTKERAERLTEALQGVVSDIDDFYGPLSPTNALAASYNAARTALTSQMKETDPG